MIIYRNNYLHLGIKMLSKYDIIILGGGTTGLVASKYAVLLGAKTLVIEADRIGGDCTWTGCVPSKSLVFASSLVKKTAEAIDLGFIEADYKVKFNDVRDYINKTVNDIYEEEKPEVLQREGIDVLIGEAHFVSSKEVEVDGQRFRAKKFIIATGAKPIIPRKYIDGLDDVPYLTSDSIFGIPELPKHLLVLGAGPIGCELSQAFRRLGSKVTLIDMMKNILPREPKEVSSELELILKAEGIQFALGDPVKKVKQNAKGEIEVFTKAGNKIIGSDLLIAVGREPAIEKLSLEKAGVKVSSNRIILDKYLRTSKKHIYAAGDCVTQYKFTHIAGYQGYIAVRNALLPFNSKGMPKYISWTTFTDPEVAFAGETKKINSIVSDEFEKHTLTNNQIDRARTDNQIDGFIQIYSSTKGKIIGASIVSSRAGELIHEFLLAMLNKTSISKIAKMVHSYPTYSMGNMQLAGNIVEKNIFQSYIGGFLKKISRIYRSYK